MKCSTETLCEPNSSKNRQINSRNKRLEKGKNKKNKKIEIKNKIQNKLDMLTNYPPSRMRSLATYKLHILPKP
uniref:Uncharacterized protein n=1 Tax=Anguilla anguilla TaxID=7936 RepID=A0A0E9W6T8_ANGAN